MADDPYAEIGRLVSLDGLLGYLNFSEGKPDPRFQKQLSDAYQFLSDHGAARPSQVLHKLLADRLASLKSEGSAFRNPHQAEAILRLVFERVLPAYCEHHAELLFHLSDRQLDQPFFLARVCEAVLAQGSPWEEEERISVGASARLNDFVGHRPVAILETRPRGEPYDHERVRPIPLFIRQAGVASGRYRELIARGLDILRSTDSAILADASFDLELLDELALDPRAYDHAHPANRRPNYVFGEWDPHHLDNQGRYRRYVVRQVTLDALLDRIEHPGDIKPDQALFEAAAVFAGTVLMAAGVSGSSPTCYDSTITLSTLMPRIARYRDAFYTALLEKVPEPHATRLREEAARTRQPFGGARQHLNQYLARQRASQLQHRHLAMLFAEMGYPDASRRQAAHIPTPSTRLLSEIHSLLATGQWHVDRGELANAAGVLPQAEDLLHRGLACGALADPWNILGFQGMFPLDRAQEDAVRDSRIDELIATLERIFDLYARLLSEAAAAGEHALVDMLRPELRRLAAWWDQFASVEVSEVRRLHGGETVASAQEVADALALWHERGQATADLAFWREHLDRFRSPKAFALVIDALLAKADYRAAMGLLINWLGQAEQIPLDDGDYSFHQRALRWMLAVTRAKADAESSTQDNPLRSRGWSLARKFFDYLEANAEDFWEVPALETPGEEAPTPRRQEEELYQAAYEGVTYRDTTDDDQEGAIADGGSLGGTFELESEAPRLEKRLRFLATVARLWQIAARLRPGQSPEPDRVETLRRWLATAHGNRQRLRDLMAAVHACPIPVPVGSPDSLIEYDRRRVLKEQILFGVIGTCLETTLSTYAMRGVLDSLEPPGETASAQEDEPAWGPAAVRLEEAFLKGDPARARAVLPEFVQHFQKEPLLFPSLAHGGEPEQVLRVWLAQNILRALAANLPRLGLLREAYQLLKTAHAMEHAAPAGGPGLTEFSRLFQAGYQAVVKMVIDSAASWGPAEVRDADLVRLLERITEPFLTLWVEHSQTVHVSTLETIRSDDDWNRVRGFVQEYGADLFHARFMTLANLRGILHRGAGAYLDYLVENPDPLHPVRLADDLGGAVSRADAAGNLQLILQAVIENYEEYKDYNTSTAQSDYGENLYMLLDFLLLKTSYERWAWHFRPLGMVHDVLVRCGRHGAAVRWQEAVARLSRGQALQHLQRLELLEQTHGMCLRTVRDRLEEQFVRPLARDRLCALVKPVMDEAHQSSGGRSFARLEQELRPFAETPTGVGLDVPDWIQRLGLEVQRVRAARHALAILAEDFFQVPKLVLSPEEMEQQVRDWQKPLADPEA